MKKLLILPILTICVLSCVLLSACDKIYDKVNGISFSAGEVGITITGAYIYRVHIFNDNDKEKIFVAVDFKIKDHTGETKNGVRLVKNNGHIDNDKLDIFTVNAKSSGVVEIIFQTGNINYSNGLKLCYMNKAVYQIN